MIAGMNVREKPRYVVQYLTNIQKSITISPVRALRECYSHGLCLGGAPISLLDSVHKVRFSMLVFNSMRCIQRQLFCAKRHKYYTKYSVDASSWRCLPDGYEDVSCRLIPLSSLL